MPERSTRGRVMVPLWARVLLPLIVLGVALLIGSGAFDSSPETVAQSNSTTAIAVRNQIESMVAAGSSTADINQTLVSEYGQTILLTPPDSGGIPLIWIIPLVLGVGAVVAVGVLFWRRNREFEALREHEVVP